MREPNVARETPPQPSAKPFQDRPPGRPGAVRQIRRQRRSRRIAYA